MLTLTPEQEDLLRQYLAQNPGAAAGVAGPASPRAPSPAAYVGMQPAATGRAPTAAPAMPALAGLADAGYGGEGFQKWGRAAGARAQGSTLGESFMAGLGKGTDKKKNALDKMGDAADALDKASKFASL